MSTIYGPVTTKTKAVKVIRWLRRRSVLARFNPERKCIEMPVLAAGEDATRKALSDAIAATL